MPQINITHQKFLVFTLCICFVLFFNLLNSDFSALPDSNKQVSNYYSSSEDSLKESILEPFREPLLEPIEENADGNFLDGDFDKLLNKDVFKVLPEEFSIIPSEFLHTLLTNGVVFLICFITYLLLKIEE
jgi:predicted PurR-regulated permease PerM